MENSRYVLAIQRHLESDKPAFDNPFFVKLTPQLETDFWPSFDKSQVEAESWIAKINETLNKTGREKKWVAPPNAAQASFAF